METDHRAIAVRLFNRCWELLDVPPSDPRNDEIERAAFASLYHWSQVGDEKNIAIGEWMIAHMYLALGRLEEAERFARRVITVCEFAGLQDFYLAYGYLEMARIMRSLELGVSNLESPELRNPYPNLQTSQDWLALARSVEIPDPDDRAHFEEDLAKDGW